MSVERRRNPDLQILVSLGELLHDGGQVALQVNPQGEEVRDHQDAARAGIRQMRHGLGQAGPGFQKGRLHAVESAGGGCRFRHGSYRFVGGWDAGSVRKDDNSRIHRYYEHSNMLKRLMVAVVGMAMGGLAGLVVAWLGAGNIAILLGAALGGLVFSIAAPRAGRAA